MIQRSNLTQMRVLLRIFSKSSQHTASEQFSPPLVSSSGRGKSPSPPELSFLSFSQGKCCLDGVQAKFKVREDLLLLCWNYSDLAPRHLRLLSFLQWKFTSSLSVLRIWFSQVLSKYWNQGQLEIITYYFPPWQRLLTFSDLGQHIPPLSLSVSTLT